MWIAKLHPLLPADRLTYVILMELLRISVGTLLITCLLETLCLKYVLILLKTKPRLYVAGILYNLFNHCLVALVLVGPVLRWYVPK